MKERIKEKEEKTNVGRVLEENGIPYTPYSYGDGTVTKGTEAARLIGKDPEQVFKTLVTQGKSGRHYVFVIPVAESLDLRKAAAHVKEKNIEMIPQKELLPLTGYVHGGCSPVGMKKSFPITFDETAVLFDTIVFSAGKIGHQVEVSLGELARILSFDYADVTET